MLLCTEADPRWSRSASILLINGRTDRPSAIDPAHFLTATGGSFTAFREVLPLADGPALTPGLVRTLEAGDWSLFEATAIASPKPTPDRAANGGTGCALAAPRDRKRHAQR